MSTKKNIVSVRLTDEQYAFFADWQAKLEEETGISVPLGAILRRALDGFMHQCSQQEGGAKRKPKTIREHSSAAPAEGDAPANREESIKKYIFGYTVE